MIFIASILLFNIYAWWRLRGAFLRGMPPWYSIALFAVIMLLAFMPLTCRLVFGRHGTGWLSDVCTVVTWTWLAWCFWFATVFAAMDLWNLAMKLCKCRWCILPFWEGVCGIAFVTLASVWGIVEAGCIRYREVEIASPKIPEAADGYRIALITDLHVSPCLRRSVVEKAVELVKLSKPDLLLNAGDFLDAAGEREQSMAKLFLDVPVSGRFSIIGNHEVYFGTTESVELHELGGFHVLRDCGMEIGDWLYVHGVDDDAIAGHYSVSPKRKGKPSYETVEVAEKCSKRFSILLKHRPEPDETARRQFDLMMSGHSHGGQIFPFTLLVKAKYPLGTGLYEYQEGLKMYTSPGTGTWGPPFRVFARPEVTIFILNSLNPKV
ncbi:MAG: metallophosphoesterase [Lentisphaeria bacterium]|nr:metallophosphoesterase [Lentisphaeria bacterium]